MKSIHIRNKFIHFFEKKNHLHKASSSLVPLDDPTLLFANAGMNQFKDYFTGKAKANNPRAITFQKCARAGGKHNDLENVGFTARHHTFFEMLGNFSFGDYFKKEAIAYAWEFLTKELNIPEKKLFISVHESDDEALDLWLKTGVPKERIFKMGDADNFWEMGDIGPCGPCSEIYYDHGEKYQSREIKEGENPLLDEDRYVEIWNLVFMQFEQTHEGRKPLPKPSVDTGMGLERLAACLQGVYWNYDTDLFRPIIKEIEKLTGADYKNSSQQASIRVLSDHIRAATMLITDGVIPSNEGRGYVLRRIIRRAIRHLGELGVTNCVFYKLVPSVFQVLGETYPENKENMPLAQKLLKLEEEKFRETLQQGMKLLSDEISSLHKGGTLPGEIAFKLYDTYGFPLDLTEVILLEKNLNLDSKGFEKAMEEQKARSQKSQKFQMQQDHKSLFYKIKEENGETIFTGYDRCQSTGTLLKSLLINEETFLVFDQTPFYGESGGQIGDTGEILRDGQVIARVLDTEKPIENLWVHKVKPLSPLKEGEVYKLCVNKKRRELIKKNHSGTHLLQAALTKVLGNHIKQAGSLVTDKKLRFDFTHTQALSQEEIQKVSSLVNQYIQEEIKVSPKIMSKEKALETGAQALFGEKYGDEVRVVFMGADSIEFCGGTHVENTGDIALFEILSEGSLSSGVRRIEALTSENAIEFFKNRSYLLSEIEGELKVSQAEVPQRVRQIAEELKRKNKEIENLKNKLQQIESKNLFEKIEETQQGLSLFTAYLKNKKAGELRNLSDSFFNENKESSKAILLLATDQNAFLVRRHKTLSKAPLNEILKEIFTKIPGRGGGKPDLVQGSFEKGSLKPFTDEWLKKIKEIS